MADTISLGGAVVVPPRDFQSGVELSNVDFAVAVVIEIGNHFVDVLAAIIFGRYDMV